MTDSEKPAVNLPVAKPALAADRRYTLPPRRLAGSPTCLNCGTELKGPFCYYCGQPDKNLLRFFPALVRDVLEDVIDLDSRFVRTLKPLLLHPGKLTRDYLEGRRFRYVPPMRLYIFTSMAFFILAAMLTGDLVRVQAGEEGSGIHIGWDSGSPEGSAEIDRQLQAAVELGALSPEEAEQIEARVEEARTARENADDESDGTVDDDGIMIDGKPWNRETNPFTSPWLPEFVVERINDEIEESPQKAREIEANPSLIVDKIFDVLPIAVFVMLPLVALLFKFFYMFAGKYYVEHLIHALHNHAFLFLVFILIVIIDFVIGWLDPDQAGRPAEVADWMKSGLLIWIPLYLLISLKTVYRQGWGATLVKYSMIGISYLVLLTMVTVGAAILSFVLL